MSVWTKRPVISVTAQDPRVLGYQTKHGWSRTAYPGNPHRQPTDTELAIYRRGGKPRWILRDAEVLPGLNLVGCAPAVQADNSMVPAEWDFGTVTDDYWRLVRTETTVSHWLKFSSATLPGYALSYGTYYYEPGLYLRIRAYSPPAALPTPSHIGISLIPAGQSTAKLALRLPRNRPGSASATQWYNSDLPAVKYGRFTDTDSTPDVQLPGAIDLQPGRTLALAIRVVRDHLLVYGPGMAEPWVTPLGDEWRQWQHGRVRFDVAGGMCLIHLAQATYRAEGRVNEYEAVNPPADVDTSATAHVSGYTPPGTALAASWSSGKLAAVLSALPHRTPLLAGLSERRATTLATVSDAGVAVGGVTRALVKLTYAGRLQTCGLWLDDYDRTEVEKLLAGAVVTVAAQWDGDVSSQTVFKGRVIDPRELRRGQSDEREHPHVTLIDDGHLLDQGKRMVYLSGSYAYCDAKQTLTELFEAAGVAGSRLTIPDTGAVLRPQDPASLQFRPDESILRAVDTVCAVLGWEWHVRADGDVVVGPPPVWSTAAFTLQDSDDDPELLFDGIAYERSLAGDYANRITVVSISGQRPSVVWYQPTGPITDNTNPGYVGMTYEHVEVGEYDNPLLTARRLYADRLQHDRMVTWSTPWLDFGSLITPRTWGTTGTIAGVGLASGLKLLVREAVWDINCGGQFAEARGDYIATVEA